MRKVRYLSLLVIRFSVLAFLSALLVIARYFLRTPQLLDSVLEGEARLFKWTHRHIFYKVHGPADATPIVLLHTPEIAASSYEMRNIVKELSQDYRVFALDLLGFGLSDRPNIEYSSDIYVTLCHDFLVSVVSRPAILLASGLSCNYSVALARRYPELCERIILLSPTALFARTPQLQAGTQLLRLSLPGLFVYAFLTIRPILRYVVASRNGIERAEVKATDLNYYYAAAHQFGAEHAALAFLTGRLLLDVSSQIPMVHQPMLMLTNEASSDVTHAVAEQHQLMQTVSVRNTKKRAQEEDAASVIADVLQWIETTTTSALETATALAGVNTDTVEEGATTDSSNEQEISRVVQIPLAGGDVTEEIEAYCVKCKQKRIMLNPIDTVTKNGRSAKEGNCPVCGTRLFRFVAS